MEEGRQRTMLVTGASGGIGMEIAAQAAEQGWVVAVHGSRPQSAEAAVGRLSQRVGNGRFLAVDANYNHPQTIAPMVEKVVTLTGGLDAVIDCAVTSPQGVGGPFLAMDPAIFAAHAAAALGPMQMLCHAALPHLSRNGGAIIAFVADSGRFAAARQAVIGASRAGIIGFVRNLGLEVARDGVRVNCISLSFVADTPIFERFSGGGGRADKAAARAGLGLPTPGDIAPLALFLCGPGAEKVTGQVISINGGLNA